MLIFSWIVNHAKMILCVALGLILLLAGMLVWGKFHSPTPVTFESREQAATPAGVEKAAVAAQVSISQTQAAEIASVIKGYEGKAPDTTVKSTGDKLRDTIKTELKNSGGQFAIVTDSNKASVTTAVPPPAKASTTPPAPPITTTTLGNTGVALPNTPIILNQYNIKAYPDRLIQIGGSYREVLTSYSWKVDVPKIPLITQHGAVGYLGIYGHANFDHPNMSRIGIMLTVPK